MGVSVVTCGYGASAVTALRMAVERAKGDDPMAPVTVLAPSNRAAIVARRGLAAGVAGRSGVAGIEVTSIGRLAERIAAPQLAPRRPATSPVIAAAIRTAVSGSSGPLAPMADHPATISALTTAHEELRTVDRETLPAIEESSAVAKAVVAIHRQTTATLQEDWYDADDALIEAAAHVDRSELGTCILHLPDRLTAPQLRFLDAVADQTELIIVAGFTGVLRADQEVRRVCDFFDLEAQPQGEIAVADKIINATDSDDEVRCVVAEVISVLSDTPADRVAVLYSNATPYARLLHDQLHAAGIMVNGFGTVPIAERATVRMMTRLLALVDHDVPRADLFRAIASAPVQDFAGERIPVSRWERISRSAGVVAGTDWTARLDAYLADRQAEIAKELAAEEPQASKIERLRQDAATASALQAFVDRLRQELVRATTLTRWSELARWCQELLTALLGPEQRLERLPIEERSAIASLILALRAAASLDAIESRADLGMLRDLLETELLHSIPRVGRFGEGVFVGPLSAAVGLDLDAVFVVGMSEDLYPGSLRIDPLLGQRARAAADGQLPRQSDQLNRRQHRFLAALAAGRDAVVSFPRGDLRRSSRRLPSRFLLPSLRHLGDDHELTATDWDTIDHVPGLTTSSSFAGRLLTTETLASEQEWRTRAFAAGTAGHDPVVRSATDMITARSGSAFTRYDGNLSGLAGLPDFAAGQELVSPTRLELYAKCPHAFFVERMLGVRPIEQPEDIVVISAMDIGTLIHEAMDELVTEYEGQLPGYGEPWSTDQQQRLHDLARAKAEDFTRRGLTGHPRLWEAKRVEILADVENILIEDDRWRAERNARVAASELPFGLRGEPPVAVEIPGGSVLMRGSADRIDIGQDGRIYVTDLKTGSKSSYRDLGQNTPTAGGTRLQLPVYGYAARQRFGDHGSPVTAMYWFVRKDLTNRLGLQLTSDVEHTYAETLSNLVRAIATGLFPAKAPDQPDFAFVQCAFCNPDGIGHQEVRRRWERQRTDPLLHDLITLIDPDATEAS